MGTASRTCISCDTPLPPEAKFCLNCGTATPAETGQHPSTTSPTQAQYARLKEALADRYRIERVLGQGGMATVYLAEDLRHPRKVAVKVLRPELAAALGSDRFLREIGIAAQLQHPHILMLIDSGEADGFLYYVMPFVEGESLRQKLVRERELPISEAVRILHDVVDALAHAHSHGVVHRDIKPDNVLLSGRHALVVDFGVAKAVSQATGQFAPTTAGLSLGTPSYMAPEQAVADPHIDHRADIYAVGAMAYELLTGTPPIGGETPQAILAAQVTESPRPVDEVRPTVPLPLAQLVMRCLEKRPADRWQSADELLPQLESLTTPGSGTTPSTTPVVASRRWIRWAAIGSLAVLVIAIGVVLMRLLGPQVVLPQPQFQQLTFDGNVELADLSPDGQWVAYTVVDDGKATIMVKDLGGGSSLVIADSVEGSPYLNWSPEGSRLAVKARGEDAILVFPRLGGAAQRLRDGWYPEWSPDGTRIAAMMEDRLVEVRYLGSGEADSIVIPGTDEFGWTMDWSPHRELLALTTTSLTGNSSLWVVNLTDGSHVLTLADSVTNVPRWAPTGDAIYYLWNSNLYRIAVDPRNGRATGVAERIVTLEGSGLYYSVSDDGRKLVYTKTSGYTNFSLARVREDGSAEQVTLTTGTASKRCPTLSPDGAALAFLQESGDGTDLYRMPTSGGTPERLTFGGTLAEDVCPAWGPVGQRLAVGVQEGARRMVAVVATSGGTPRTFENTSVSEEIAWTPNTRIAYQVPGNHNFRILDPETEEESELERLVEGRQAMFFPHFSPEGNMLAVAVTSPPGWQGVWVLSLVDSSRVQLAGEGVYPLGWSADGETVYTRDSAGVIRRLPLLGGEGMIVPPPALGDASCTPHERAAGLLWVCSESEFFSDVWMVEDFDPEMAGRSR